MTLANLRSGITFPFLSFRGENESAERERGKGTPDTIICRVAFHPLVNDLSRLLSTVAFQNLRYSL